MENLVKKQRTSRVTRAAENVILRECVILKLKKCMFFWKIMRIIVRMRERLQGKNDAKLSLPLQGKIINILNDSGASTNVIDKSTYELVKTTENCLSKSNAKIYLYGSKVPLDLLGKTKLKMQIGGSEHEIDFQVIKGTGEPLIGRKSATKQGLDGMLGC